MKDDYSVIMVSSIEIFRRAMWAFFRVENEVVSNLENYRDYNFRVPNLSENEIPKNVNKDDRSINQSQKTTLTIN